MPNSEVLKVAEKEIVEDEVVIDFPAMVADGKNEASLRKVVIEEVLVPVVRAPTTGGVFDRFPQSPAGNDAPCEYSAAEFEAFYVSALDDHRQGRPV